MNTKIINTRSAVIGLALLMFNVGSVLAGSITLNGATGNSCAFSTYTADSSGNLTVTCATTTTNPTVAPVCAPYASVNPISAGGATTLYSSCSNVTNTTTYVWAVSNSNFSTASSVGVNPQANTTYSVIATNNVGPSTPASVTVTVSTTPPPTGQTTPTSTSPLTEIVRWNKAFALINYIPWDGKAEQVSLMEYNKLIQRAKPSIYFLPTSW